MAVTGCNFVRFTRHGLMAIRKTWPVMADRFEIRRMGLKLKFWDERHTHEPGRLMDHEYEKIKSISNASVYELRVSNNIGGHDNIRIVFYDPPSEWEPILEHRKPMRSLWILEALQKKRDDWSSGQIDRFRISTKLLNERVYGRQF